MKFNQSTSVKDSYLEKEGVDLCPRSGGSEGRKGRNGSG